MLKKVKRIIRRYPQLTYHAKNLNFSFYKILTYIIKDEAYIKIQYKNRLGKTLNLENPTLYNEKIQWLKLNYKDPLLNQCVDKWEVKDYVRSKGLSNILIPAIGLYDTIEEVDFEKLPNEFILKLTNGSSFNEICFDKSKINVAKVKRKFKKWAKINSYVAGREWAYKDVENRVMAEELLRSKKGELPSDYRFYCFEGNVKFVAVDLDSVTDTFKNTNYYRHLYTIDWELIPATIEYPNKESVDVERPENFKEMLEIAKVLSKDFPAVRVDLYNIDGKIYFGELTFYHASGYQKVSPVKFEKEMGSWIDLSTIKNNKYTPKI